MSTLRPIDTGTLAPIPTLKTGKGKTAVKASSEDTDAATRAQIDARERIDQAQKDLARTQREIEQNQDYIREQYDKQSVAESIRQEDALQSQQNKGYEKLRDLQRAQTAELARVQRQGDKQLEETKQHYETAITSTEKKGENDLQKLAMHYYDELETDKKMNDATLAEARAQQTNRYSRSRDDREQKLQAATENAKVEFDRLRENASLANDRAEENFKNNLAGINQRQTEYLNQVNSTAVSKIKEIRGDTARKLAAYATRQKDPFYKLVDLGAQLEDRGDSFVLTAAIPKHEQEHISVNLKGQSLLVVSGTRHNEEKLDLSPGRAKSTSSYQSYSESFPLPVPVDGRQLTKHFDGETLTISVPKLPAAFQREPYKGPKPEKLRVERPKFPDNIPDPGAPRADDTGPITDPKKGSRPLG